jgi:hypothetical protein
MTDTARDQALAQVQSIVEMVAALDCDYDQLEFLRGERDLHESGPNVWAAQSPDDARELEELETAAGDCTSPDDAMQGITEDALSVEVRSGWASMGEKLTPEEFRIVLCTGGPHVEIVGQLNEHGDPASVRVLYRDWGTSGELYDFDRAAVTRYCECFYFGE